MGDRMNMDRNLILSAVQILISLLLVGAILLQAKGVGLSATFGGEGGFYHTKRGVEKVLFIATIVLAVVFIVLSLLGSVI